MGKTLKGFQKGKSHPNYKDGRTLEIKYCACGKEISYRAKKCNSCNKKGSKLKGVMNRDFWGENNPRWKGGKENYYRRKARAIYYEYHCNVVCQSCSSDNDLNIHHIDLDVKNNNLDNLVALCRKCHTRLHNREGNGKNNKKTCSTILFE